MGKKLMMIVLVLVLATTILTSASYENIRQISVGDYITMGIYNGKPILWRCVAIDENGPLMISDRILSLKPFDGKGSHETDNNNIRLSYGSDNWVNSNIRTWLNAAGKVTYPCGNAPSSNNVDGNAYDGEDGFLTWFSNRELSAIKSVFQYTVVNGIDNSKATGTESHAYETCITSCMQNYDSAYKQSSTDRIFLLDMKQVYNIYQNRSILGDGYYNAIPTTEAVKNSNYTDNELTSDSNWYYWLRTAYGDENYPTGVRFVGIHDSIYSLHACEEGVGIRPAFYLNMSSEWFSSEKMNIVGKVFDQDGNILNISNVRDAGKISFYIHNGVDAIENCVIYTAVYNGSKLVGINANNINIKSDNNLVTINFPEYVNDVTSIKIIGLSGKNDVIPIFDYYEIK